MAKYATSTVPSDEGFAETGHAMVAADGDGDGTKLAQLTQSCLYTANVT